ncbi:MAG: hypothetical protein NC084_07250 [Bacteroides sp.]|nr:spore maturation protein A [Eubacterium sp.]MCM1418394.1 spore maturation protein A [Roseburia sp.]MCM1462495.1 hypothetical protein [Bacteroides sp.]
MMKWIMTVMTALSVVFALFTGKTAEVSEAFLSECGGAVELAISLVGIICLWSGLMRVARTAGLTERLARLFSPILGRLFRGLKKGGRATQYITLNLTANLLGLGNASTPFGLAAMREIEKEEGGGEAASHNMILFTVLNTASLQLVPTTVAALRLKNGSTAPMEILPCVWLASVGSLAAALIAASLFRRLCGGKK